MENLHTDILENILFRLPVDTALQARRVCTTWETLFRRYKSDGRGYLFALRNSGRGTQLLYGDEYEHYDHAKMNYYHSRDMLARVEPKRDTTDVMVGSCNGLVCFLRNKNDGVFDSLRVCNPLTGEYVFLPKLFSYAELFGRKTSEDSFGFGYCRSSERYKVVRIYKQHTQQQGNNNWHVHVYTVGGRWRYIELGSISCYGFKYSSGIYANGALHWLFENRKIFALDLEHEKLDYIPLPTDDYPFRVKRFKLIGDGNNIYVVCFGTHCMDIWAFKRNNASSCLKESHLKQNYGDITSWSWIKEFNIECLGSDNFMPFAITRNNEVLLWYENKILYCYDPETSTLNKLWKNNILCSSKVEVYPHVQRFFCLKDLGETDVRSYNTAAKRKVKDGEEVLSLEK